MRSVQRNASRLKRRSAAVPCTCQPHSSTLGYLSELLTITCTRTSFHHPECPHFLFQKTLTDLQLRTTLCSLILRRKISLSFTLSYGTRFSTAQNLECHRFVTSSSPAFALVKSLVGSSIYMSQETFHGEVDKLSAVFQRRQASPYDRLLDGRTLLHASNIIPIYLSCRLIAVQECCYRVSKVRHNSPGGTPECTS